jgi:hypothetical protein
MDNITRKLIETYMNMIQEPTPGYGEVEDAQIKQPETLATQTDENGNPVTDPKTGNPYIISAAPPPKPAPKMNVAPPLPKLKIKEKPEPKPASTPTPNNT